MIAHGQVTSTMDEAAGDTGTRPAIHLADRQMAGRGRRGRVWESLPGNLHATVIWPDPGRDLPPATLAAIQLAWAEAILAAGGPDARCKWPNDGYLAGRKWAGALAARSVDGAALLVGLGANLVAAPADTRPAATALALHWPAWPGRVESAALLLEAALRVLAGGRAGIAGCLARWPEHDLWEPGQAIEVCLAGERRTGRYAGLTAEGHLRLATGEGMATFASGDAFGIRARSDD